MPNGLFNNNFDFAIGAYHHYQYAHHNVQRAEQNEPKVGANMSYQCSNGWGQDSRSGTNTHYK